MKATVIKLILILYLTDTGFGQSITLNFALRGKRLTSGNILLSLQEIGSPSICVTNCLAFGSTKCKSVNYNKVTKECQLIDENQNLFDEEKFEENDDWIYYGNRERTRKPECKTKEAGTDCCLPSNDILSCRKPQSCQDIKDSCPTCDTGNYVIKEKSVVCIFNDNNYPTCKVLKQRYPSLKTGFHRVGYGEDVVEFYCDMDLEGGGWLLVANLTISDVSEAPNLHYDLIKKTQLTSLQEVRTGAYALAYETLRNLRTQNAFSEIRIKCRKAVFGKLVHVVLMNVDQFVGIVSKNQKLEGTDFRFLPDDEFKSFYPAYNT
eukprot:TCONS_00060014-protein